MRSRWAVALIRTFESIEPRKVAENIFRSVDLP
jgi:hypothetical protein